MAHSESRERMMKMIKYIVLLSDTALGITETGYALPEEFLNNIKSLNVFSQREEAFEFIASKLTFDDMWEFGAPDGLIPGKVYHRSKQG